MAYTYPTTFDGAIHPIHAPASATAKLSGNHSATVTALDLVDASGIGTTGVGRIGGEIVTWGGKTSNQLTTVTRAKCGTKGANHFDGDVFEVITGAVALRLSEQATIADVAVDAATNSPTDAPVDASVAHALNATFADTEVEAALNALGTKINSVGTKLNTVATNLNAAATKYNAAAVKINTLLANLEAADILAEA